MYPKRRITYAILLLLTIPLGLATRSSANLFFPWVTAYAGDVLYATCLFFLLRLLFTGASLFMLALVAYCVCAAIEASQLYQAQWIQTIRHTPPFGTILGYGFLWSDLVCYAVGIVIALLIALLLERLSVKETEKK